MLDASEDEDDFGDNFNYEKRALIGGQQDTGDDEIDLFSAQDPHTQRSGEIRQRLSKGVYDEQHELNLINGGGGRRQTRDLISEPVIEYTFYDIKSGDTLHSICLRYACPLAQVKRINGLMNDQEFYGLRRIKLPKGKLGLLEQVLTSQQSSGSPTHQLENNRQKIVISPGSALSVSTSSYGHHGAKFKPHLSPGYSSDRINELNRFPNGLTPSGELAAASSQHLMKSPHSHSFSSLRDYTNQENDDTNQQHVPEPIYIDTRQLQTHNFIKTHFDTDRSEDQIIVDNIPNATNHVDNVDKVFEDLDYHVEKAKVAAESYDQRASEIVNRIDINGTPPTSLSRGQQRVSKIPELFFCNENFGLSYKKLLVFIIIVCLFVPLIYINQAKIVTT